MAAAAVSGVACASAEGPTATPAPDLGDIRVPPDVPPGDGCDEVTAFGWCDDLIVRFCDTTADTVRELDCSTFDQICVEDPERGARCADAEAPGPDPEPTGPCGGLDLYGTCAGDIVRWCEDDVPKAVDCGAAGLACASEVCFDGAACCEPADVAAACLELGERGACGGGSGELVRWCMDGELHESLDCSELGLICQVDVCGEGAHCCAP